jgi:hypothetical protein
LLWWPRERGGGCMGRWGCTCRWPPCADAVKVSTIVADTLIQLRIIFQSHAPEQFSECRCC